MARIPATHYQARSTNTSNTRSPLQRRAQRADSMGEQVVRRFPGVSVVTDCSTKKRSVKVLAQNLGRWFEMEKEIVLACPEPPCVRCLKPHTRIRCDHEMTLTVANAMSSEMRSVTPVENAVILARVSDDSDSALKPLSSALPSSGQEVCRMIGRLLRDQDWKWQLCGVGKSCECPARHWVLVLEAAEMGAVLQDGE